MSPWLRTAAITALACLALGACESDESSDRAAASAGATAPSPGASVMDAAVPGERVIQVPGNAPPAPPTLPTGQGPLSIDPSLPLANSRVVARVLSPSGDPVPDVAVRAGGKAFFTDTAGFAVATEVRGDGATSVTATRDGRVWTQVRVELRDGEDSYALLVLGNPVVSRIDDVSRSVTLPLILDDGGVDDPYDTGLELSAPADAFAHAWGEPASGTAHVAYILQDRPAEAAAVPGGMQAIVDDRLIPLWGRAAIELHVHQGATELELTEEVELSFPLEPLGAAELAQLPPLSLYHFDARRQGFVERGSVNVEADRATLTVDALGHWLIAGPAGEGSCVRGSVQDETGAAAPHAAVRVTGSDLFVSSHLTAGADGSFCAPGPPSASEVRGLARTAAGLVYVGDSVTSTGVASCDGTSCAAAELTNAMLSLSCVSGSVEAPFGPIELEAVVVGSEDVRALAQLSPGESFCVSLEIGEALQLGGSNLDCGPPITGASQAALCGLEGCLDVGEIACCRNQELCVNGEDDDCDDRIDEGCSCNGVECPYVERRCCDAANLCGSRSPETDTCFAPFGYGTLEATCPDETIELSAGAVREGKRGCCRMDGACGVWDPSFECVPRTSAHLVWSLPAPLAAVACTP